MNDDNKLNININRMRDLSRVLHCPKRWKIIAILDKEEMTTSTILEHLNTRDEEISMQTLYYHLKELKNAGIIDIAGYEDKQQGAPEKIWELIAKEININLINKQEVRNDM